MDQQQAQQFAQKILAGEGSLTEKQALQEYLANFNGAVEDHLFPLHELNVVPADTALPEGMEGRVLASITGKMPTVSITEKRPALIRSLWRMGAAAVVLIVASLVVYRFLAPRRTPAGSELALQTITVPAGHSKMVTLADGSLIQLNGGTTLRFAQAFTGATRDVWLDGEAFFEVSKDAAHPFIIHSAAITTTVLGTSFNVRSYRDQSLSEVAVATGKVRVAITGQAATDPVVYLTPGQKTSYHPGNGIGLQTGKTEITAVGSWKQRHFYYDQAPLSVILTDLENAYGTRFHVKNQALLQCTYTVTFKSMTAAQILHTLTLMSDVRFNKKDSLMEVSGEACN